MSANFTTVDMILAHEGFKAKPYIDPLVLLKHEEIDISKEEMKIIKKHFAKLKITIGAGFTYLNLEHTKAVLALMVKDIYNGLNSKYSWFKNISLLRQGVIISMVYQMGFEGFNNFKNTIAYIKAGDFEKAAIEMLDSKWARELHKLDMIDGVDSEDRAEYLADLFRTDVYRKRVI